MNNRLDEKVKDFVKFIRENSPKDAVAFNLFINYKEHEIEFRHEKETEAQSWRNLGGDWVE